MRWFQSVAEAVSDACFFMRRKFFALLVGLLAAVAGAQDFDACFADSTLRVDYIFSGDASHVAVSVSGLSSLPRWAGRRHNLPQLPLEGNGQVVMTDVASGEVVYCHSFSSLFQEWLETAEARAVCRAFENVCLLPFPLRPVDVTVTLYDAHRKPQATLTHRVSPDDILIRHRADSALPPHKTLLRSGSSRRCIDVVILAEGYTAGETALFYADAATACESLFAHEPFKSLCRWFNVVAVATPSADSGVSVPRLGLWKQTAFGSHFSTFYSDRYLTTSRLFALHDAVADIPYEHIVVLANTGEYGGGGIYNSCTLTAAHHPDFGPVVVHEFGHSFAGLADEYCYEGDAMNGLYPPDVEPWEPNITTLVRFGDKWQDLLAPGTPLPTPLRSASCYPVGVYEGGGYSPRGVYRPAADCRMRSNDSPDFCPVCQRAIRRLVEFYIGETTIH